MVFYISIALLVGIFSYFAYTAYREHKDSEDRITESKYKEKI